MIVPPPTPKRPLNAPAAVAMAASRANLDDTRGILRAVSAPTADALAETLRPLTGDPGPGSAVLRHRRHARADSPARRGGTRAGGGVGAARAARPPLRPGGLRLGARRGRGAPARGRGQHLLRGLARRRAARGRREAAAPDRSLQELGGADPGIRRRARHERAARAARADRGQGRDRRLPLARRARRGRRAHAARGHGRRGRGRGPAHPLGPQGARGAAAGADRQGPGGARPALALGRAAAPCSAATTPPTSTPSPRSPPSSSDGELEAAVRVGVRSDEGPAAIVEDADIVVDGVPGFARVLAALAEA